MFTTTTTAATVPADVRHRMFRLGEFTPQGSNPLVCTFTITNHQMTAFIGRYCEVVPSERWASLAIAQSWLYDDAAHVGCVILSDADLDRPTRMSDAAATVDDVWELLIEQMTDYPIDDYSDRYWIGFDKVLHAFAPYWGV